MKKLNVILIFIFLFSLPGIFANAAPPTIALTYFDDLSKENQYTGFSKALTEIVLVNLTKVDGIQLVDRDHLQKLMKEMELGLSGMVNENSAAKVGNLLGAQYFITGNYLINEKSILISYKILEVQTSKIINAGNAQDNSEALDKLILNLSYAIAVSLQKISPDIKPNKDKMNAFKISLPQINNFGKALDSNDRGDYKQAEDILKNLLNELPQFNMAKNQLDEVENSIKESDKIRDEELKKEINGPLNWQSFNKITQNYLMSMQYTKLYNFCNIIRNSPPTAPAESTITAPEMIGYYLSFSAYMLKKWPICINESETFIKNYPTSIYYNIVKMNLNKAVDEIKNYDHKVQKVDDTIKQLSNQPQNKDNKNFLYYQIANTYFQNQLYREALNYYKKINLSELQNQYKITPDNILYFIFNCYYNMANKKEAEKIVKSVEKLYPDSAYLESIKTMFSMFPE